jgi:hypothetical protein
MPHRPETMYGVSKCFGEAVAAYFALQKHLGHETLEMVRIYANLTDQDAEEEKRKYSPADNIELEPKKITQRGFRKG